MKRLFTRRNLLILAGVVLLFVVHRLLGLEVGVPHVSIKAEPIFNIGPFEVTNALFTAWIVMILLAVLAYLATRLIPKDLAAAKNEDLVPSGLQNIAEMLIEGFYRLVKEMSGSWTAVFFPIVMTIFLFVIASNWLGLIPGVGSIGQFVAEEAGESAEHGLLFIPLFRSPSADLNFTIALAIASVVLTQYFGFRSLKSGYFHRFFDFSGFKNGALVGVAQAFAGLLELMGEFIKIISFSFRLFGNIFAGEVLLGVMAFLIPYIASLPFYGLELFVGFIQAVVFMMLTLVFFVNATSGHAVEAVAGHDVAGKH